MSALPACFCCWMEFNQFEWNELITTHSLSRSNHLFTQKLWVVIREILRSNKRRTLNTTAQPAQQRWLMFIQNQHFLCSFSVLARFRLSSSSFISNIQTITFETTLFERAIRCSIPLSVGCSLFYLFHTIIASTSTTVLTDYTTIYARSTTQPTFNNRTELADEH